VRKKRKGKKKSKEGGLSPQEGDVRKKRKEKDQGRWSIATRRGREKNKKRKEKKRKRPRQARRWLQRRQGSVCPTPRILFLVHKCLEAARLS
jgi:hypothetical protein